MFVVLLQFPVNSPEKKAELKLKVSRLMTQVSYISVDMSSENAANNLIYFCVY